MQIPKDLKLTDTPRALRPRCGAITRAGTPCRAQALKSGLCYAHTPGVPKGISTPEARAAAAERARKTFKRLWETDWANGHPFTPEGLARISAAQKARSPESRKISEETKRKMSASAKARLASPEARARVSEQMRQRHAARREEAERARPPGARRHSEEARRRMSEAAKARLANPQTRQRQIENIRRGQAAKREAAQREGAA
jgi:hypothetical protein